MSDSPVKSALPRISIVTPSFNQGEFLEQTICSVLDQNYPNLEYVIIDGGSKDNSRDVIRRYESRLAWWVSEPDQGQYEAINKGFTKTSGEILAWLNADDKYLPWTLSVVSEVLGTFPQIEWLTTTCPLFWDHDGTPARCESVPPYSRRRILRGGTLPGSGWPATAFIQQESTFWRRSLWERCGGRIDSASAPLAGDFDLWACFARQAEIYNIPIPLAGFRQHATQKTARQLQAYLAEARQCLLRHGGYPPGKAKSFWFKNTGKLMRWVRRRLALDVDRDAKAVLRRRDNRWILNKD